MTPAELAEQLSQVAGVTVSEKVDGLLEIANDGFDDQWEQLPTLLLDSRKVEATSWGIGPNGQHLQFLADSGVIIVAPGDFAFEPLPQPNLFGDILPTHVQGLPWLVSWTEARNQLAAALVASDGDFDGLTAQVLTSAAFIYGALEVGLQVPASALEQFSRLLEHYSEM